MMASNEREMSLADSFFQCSFLFAVSYFLFAVFYFLSSAETEENWIAGV